MPASRGFLERFRASGTPGAAAGAGVPADRSAEREVELAALFERLAAVETVAEQMRSDGAQRADQHRQAATAQSRQILATARQQAEVERREAAARISAQAQHETEQALYRAQVEANAIAEHAHRETPTYVDRVVSEVLARLGLDPPQADPDGQSSP
jgi:hypothetical protein